jgi:uncharacterized protein YdhG (YjbR/CyaY superfamily)
MHPRLKSPFLKSLIKRSQVFRLMCKTSSTKSEPSSARPAPTAQEIIKYHKPTFTLNGNLVHFAALKHHSGLYPTLDGIEQFQGELSAYKNARGSDPFLLDQPMLFDLIRRIVKFRLQESVRKSSRQLQRRDD